MIDPVQHPATTDDAGTVPLSARLKAETSEHHRNAERRQLQKDLAAGRLPLDGYLAWLGQMYLLHDALARATHAARPHCVPLDAIVREPESHVKRLAEDLRALGVDPAAVRPLPPIVQAAAELETCAARMPLALIGHDYVLEGSTNGNRFIARNVGRALGTAALRYLDPYGEAQPLRWAEYRARLDAAPLSDEAQDRVVAAAGRMFDIIAELSEALTTAGPAAPR